MPYVPPGAYANILSNFNNSLVSWMDGADIPKNGPHTNVITQYGCTINKDFSIGEEKNGNVKIFIRGVTEYWHDNIWVENLWVPASNVDKGIRWKPNINDWDVKMDLGEWKLGSSESDSKVTFLETSVLGKTITGLINEFHTNPAPFMGTKIQALLDKRTTQKKGSSIESITKTIIQGIKDANLYATIPPHQRDRFDSHPSSTTSYGDLTRNSQPLLSSALCLMSETDIIDFAYLVEQIFVCLFESYRFDLLVSLGGIVNTASSIEHAEAVQAAHYFRKVSEKVFNETQFPGAINRSSFGVSQGANYSMPFKEWAATMEQLLFLRNDTAIKCKESGYTILMTVFRRAKPKIAHYLSRKSGSPEAYDEIARHSQKILDGTMGPRQGDPYQLVFKVRTDGQAHPSGWSRLYDIGPFYNWEEGRSLAVRIEWEYPAKSGMWRHRYLFTRNVYKFEDLNQPGSHVNYIKTISMVQWLFNAEPNKPRPWMPRLKGCAYVLQTIYNYHTQTIEVKLQEPFTMRSGGIKPRASIVAAMKALGLDNVDGPFGQQKKCDGCVMLSTKALASLGSPCIQIQGLNCCRNCMLFGRPCCSWTKNGAVKAIRAFSKGVIRGEISYESKVTSADVALNKTYRAGLHCQPLPETEQVQSFSQQLIDVVNLAKLEDDLSDSEDADEDFEGEDGE